MRVVVQPPWRACAGIPLRHPLVVTFNLNEVLQDHEQASDLEGLDTITSSWVYLSLTSEEDDQCLTPPDPGLLKGQLADSIHLHHEGRHNNNMRVIAYSKFFDLVISEPGRYRFMISIVEMNAAQPSEGGRILPSIKSDVIEVIEGATAHSAISDESGGALLHLRSMGLRI